MTEKLLKLSMKIAEQMIVSGAEINRVEDSMKRIGAAYGIVSTDIFATNSNVIISYEDKNGKVYTQTKRIKITGIDIERLDRLNSLVRNMTQNTPHPDSLTAELSEICDNCPKYKSGTLIFFYGIVAAAFSLLFDARTFEEFFVSLFTGLLVGVIAVGMDKIHTNKLLHRFICSFIAALCAYLCLHFGIISDIDKVMIANIMTLISGIGLTNSLRDLFTGDSISGVLKMIEAVMLAFSIAFGYIVVAFLFGGVV